MDGVGGDVDEEEAGGEEEAGAGRTTAAAAGGEEAEEEDGGGAGRQGEEQGVEQGHVVQEAEGGRGADVAVGQVGLTGRANLGGREGGRDD